MKKIDKTEIMNQVNEVVKEFQKIAGENWIVYPFNDDRIEFRHKEFNLSYSISILHFGWIDGKHKMYRDIEFASVASRGSFVLENSESIAYYSLIGSLLTYEHLGELNDKVIDIPVTFEEV